MTDSFSDVITAAYSVNEKTLLLGVAKQTEIFPQCPITLPLATLNRHGFIGGATGTGKTRTLQVLAEQLSLHGIPSLLMDMKGDLSGLGMPGSLTEKLQQRLQLSCQCWHPRAFPIEFLTLSTAEPGVPLRGSIQKFGASVFANMLELNDTQSGVVSMIFKYCTDENLPLVTLDDFKYLLHYFASPAGKFIQQQYGYFSAASIGTLQRQLLALEQQGASALFGLPTFEISDLYRLDQNNQGIISILRLMSIQHQPKLFVTAMLGLLTTLYDTLPEVGDLVKPKLVVFIDEAHWFFKEASKALRAQMEIMVRLIRSKGVGIWFCTQSPKDLPSTILGQLGTKIQHALRAFTAQDRKAIKLIAENYPPSLFYQIDHVLTSLSTGEALVTTLAATGHPTPVVHTYLSVPQSRMTPLNAEELELLVQQSSLFSQYQQFAHHGQTVSKPLRKTIPIPRHPSSKKLKRQTLFRTLSKNRIMQQISRTFVKELVRVLVKWWKL